jgi:uncharacterized protein
VDKIARILKCGQSVFIWDYPGFGHSKGLATLKNIGSNALSAYDYLIAAGYSPNQIVLYGESLGCGILGSHNSGAVGINYSPLIGS